LEIRDPIGIVRRLPCVEKRASPLIRSEGRDPRPEPSFAYRLEESTRAGSRMIGRMDGRYLNVGSRCVRPLWVPPAAEKEPTESKK